MTEREPGVTVIIPTIPSRDRLLLRALYSVARQTMSPAYAIVQMDRDGEGAAATRNRAIDRVATEWVAFLDDDDEFLPNHLADLYAAAKRTKADLVYPMWEGSGADDFAEFMNRPFDTDLRNMVLTDRNIIPVTVLARTEPLRAVGGFAPHPNTPPEYPCEDWGLWVRLLEAGYTFAHHPGVTWRWNAHLAQTAGRSWRQIPTVS